MYSLYIVYYDFIDKNILNFACMKCGHPCPYQQNQTCL